MPHHRAAEERRRYVAGGADNGSAQLSPRQARPAGRIVIESRPHAAGISKNLAGRYEKAKCDCEWKTQDSVESGGESQSTNGTEQGLPKQRVMILVASCSIEFNRECDAGRNAASQAEEEPEPDAVADSVHDR